LLRGLSFLSSCGSGSSHSYQKFKHALKIMNRGSGKALETKNNFADGFAEMEAAEKKKKRDAKKAAKRAVLEAERAAAPPPPVPEPKQDIFEKTMSWADCESDDDDGLMGLSPLQDSYQQERDLDDVSVSDSDDDEDKDQSAPNSPQLTFATKPTEEPAAAPQLSKKEQKQKEMDDLDAILNEMGVSAAEEAAAVPEEAPKEEPAQAQEGGKTRKRGGKKKKGGEEAATAETVESSEPAAPKDIAKIMAAKAKKKGGNKKKSAVEIAAAEAKERKAKNGNKKVDKSNYNEMPTR